MKAAKNDAQLFANILPDLKKTMELIAKDTQELWKSYLKSNFYDAHEESDSYTRTYQLLESIVYTKPEFIGDGFRVQLYADMSLLTQAINGDFIQHKQADFPLYQLIEEGYHIFGSGWVNGAYAFEDVLNDLNNKNYFLDKLNNYIKNISILK